ncbi:GDSL-type esterase/lipase family protein [uncultured Methylophaga sp.]|uniref:SGNH/GDSL hydrolase family protein n=1 Tax=uncultured Methylophaga sp. TaxID=285271 RepID=UPI0030D86F33|tara:strand:+ start:12482 stop:13237 length:756 start_codon:yes stop_codon:yes gene_type:complete
MFLKKLLLSKSFIILISSVLLLLSIMLLKISHKFYSEMMEVRLDPSGKSFYLDDNLSLQSNSEPKPNVNRVVLFGDSRIQMWGEPPELVGYEFINRGIGGQTTGQAKLRIQSDILAINADAVILQVGINDLKAIAFIPDKRDQIIQTVKDNLQSMIETLLVQDIDVYLMTVIPASAPQGKWYFLWSDDIDSAVININQWIKTIENDQVIILDPTTSLTNGLKTDNEYSLDTLHLNELGYNILNNMLKETFK